jgi:anti-sigma-K factor RskA
MEKMTQRNGHWREDDLLLKLYGLDVSAQDSHLEACPECRMKWESLVAVRRDALREPALSEDFLRSQRQRIFARVERSRSIWRWIPAPVLATAVVLTIGIALHQPAPTAPAPQVAALSDTQLISEIDTVAGQEEPRAAEALKGLFSEAQ